MPSFHDLIHTLLSDGRLYDVLRAQHRRWQRAIEFDDFTQEAMLRCWARRETFKGNSPDELLAWVRPVANSVLIDLIRRRKARRRGGEAEEVHGRVAAIVEHRVEDPLTRLIRDEQLQQIVQALEEAERLVVVGHYWGGCSFREIAELTTWPYHRVTRLHTKALRKLRNLGGL